MGCPGNKAGYKTATAVLVLSGRHLGYLPEHFAASYVEAGLLAPVNPAVLCYDVQFHMGSTWSRASGPV